MDHLNADQKFNLLKLFPEYYAIFSKNLSTLDHTDKVVHTIELLHDTLTKTMPIPIPKALQSDALNQLNEMQEAGII